MLVGDDDQARAAQRLLHARVALTSPEIHHLLTSDLAWTPAAHEVWLATLAERELLGTG